MSAPLGPEVAETTNLHLNSSSNVQHASPEKSNHLGVPSSPPHHHGTSDTSATATLIDEPVGEYVRPTGTAFYLIILGLYLAVFLFCLDISIVAPAIPVITNDFQDTSKATWFFSIYLALNTVFQPVAGPFYRVHAKWAFLVFQLIFLIGSLMCGVAPSANVFIGGRALAGLGSAGGYVGVMIIIATISPPGEQTKWVNGVGAIYSLGAVAGPLIGGAFVSHVTWRWCFYINLPIGGLTLLACAFLLPQAQPSKFTAKQRLIQCIKELDFVGTTLALGALMMLLLAMQWGGIKYDWTDSKVYGLIIGFILTVIVTVGWIIFRGENAYVRPRLAKNRSIAASMACNFAIAGAYFTVISILAYYFQIRGSSALRSGVQLLPMISGVVTALVVGGALGPIVGYTNPFTLIGMVIMTIFLGVLTLMDAGTSTAYWAGVTFAFGFGSGLCFMMPFLLAQTVLAPADLEIGTAMVLFMQTLGGAIIFAIGQAIYQNKYKDGVLAIQGLTDPLNIVNGGVTAFREIAPAQFIGQIENVALDAVKYAYYTPIATLGLAILLAWPFMEWKSIKPQPKEGIKSINAEKKQVATHA